MKRITNMSRAVKNGVVIVLGLMPSFLLQYQVAVAGKPYKGAEYRTKQSFLYGRFETRMKANGREGMLSSFFTYNDTYPATAWNEIDIEILGRYSDDVQFNTITPGSTNHASHQFVSFNPALDFHEYGFEWTPNYVAWFVDSVEVYRQTGPHIATLNISQKLMMNVWIPSSEAWAGKWNDAVLPAFAYYDWVRYASYTPGVGTIGTNKNFTPQWIDNFDSWDTTRWDKASHTWNENMCDFVYDNAFFQDGKLVLCLTKETAVGYTDLVPPKALWARAEKNSVRLFFSEEVDQAASETASNYLIQNCSVTNAHMQHDLKTVLLDVPGVDTAAASSIIVLNAKDRWSTPNVTFAQASALIRPSTLSLPVKINAGGDTTSGYLKDQMWNETVEYGHVDGWAQYNSGAQINGTNVPEVFRSEVDGLCEYKVRVPNGRYQVTLMLAENSATDTNQRTMNIVIQGKQIETNLDLFGACGFRTAYQATSLADAGDGIISIHIQGVMGQPLLNGIVVASLSSGLHERQRSRTRPEKYALLQNYPNPFNPSTTIAYRLPFASQVSLKVFDTLGREIATLVDGERQAGSFSTTFFAKQSRVDVAASGVYFYRLSAQAIDGNNVHIVWNETKPMMLVK